MARIGWPAIRDIIDSGHPCPIAVVTGYLPDFIHIGHQVRASTHQLQGQLLTVWVYDPNSPGNDDISMRLDISRTDQELSGVHSNINVGHSPICFFTQSYERREPVQGRP